MPAARSVFHIAYSAALAADYSRVHTLHPALIQGQELGKAHSAFSVSDRSFFYGAAQQYRVELPSCDLHFFIDLKDDAAVRVPKDGLRVSSFEAEAYAVSEAHLHDRLGDPSDARSVRRHRITRSHKLGCPLPDLQKRLYIRQSSSGSAVIAFREWPQQHDPVPRFLELRSCDVTGLCHRDRV